MYIVVVNDGSWIYHYFMYVVFPEGTPASSSNKTDRHDISEILLKVALNILTLTPNNCSFDINCKLSANDEE